MLQTQHLMRTHTSPLFGTLCSRERVPEVLQFLHHCLHAGCRDVWKLARKCAWFYLPSAGLQSTTSPT